MITSPLGVARCERVVSSTHASIDIPGSFSIMYDVAFLVDAMMSGKRITLASFAHGNFNFAVLGLR